jgi:hypothetical protein
MCDVHRVVGVVDDRGGLQKPGVLVDDGLSFIS